MHTLLRGTVLIVLGLFKICFSFLGFILPPFYSQVVPFINQDKSVAGLVLHSYMAIFGAYILLHGFAVLGLLPPFYDSILDNPMTSVIVYTLFGTFFVTFFSLVVFSKLKISKQQDQMINYEIVGILGGFMFYVSLLSWLLFEDWAYYLMFILLLVVAGMAVLLYKILIRHKMTRKVIYDKLITVALLPLGLMS